MEKISSINNVIDQAREFAAKEIRPFAKEFDMNERLPKEVIDKMAKKGYLAATFPKKYGGLELNPIDYGMLTEEIGKACCSTRTLLTVHTSLVGESIIRWGTENQKSQWLIPMAKGEKIGAFALTEPNVGSNAKGIETTYSRVNDKYVINGTKKWISFGAIADFFLVIASNKQEMTAFIVESNLPGVTIKPMNGLLASRASHIAQIEFNNVEVPINNLLGAEGAGFTYIASTALDHGRYSVAWAGIAIAQEALECMVSYSRTRTQFGNKICEFELIQGMIADAITNIHAARSLCMRAGELRGKKCDNAVIETTISKYFASKVAVKVTNDALQIHGGNGFSSEYPVERLYREAKVLEIIEGTSQIQQGIISRYGLRKYYKKDYSI